MLKKIRNEFFSPRFIRYILVGLWNTLLGYAVFSLLYFFFARYLHYFVILVVSNIIAVTNAYIFYKFFVFRTKGNYLIEYLRFYLVYGVSIILSLILFPLFLEFVFPCFLKKSGLYERYHFFIPYGSQLACLGVTMVVSYLGHGKFSYRGKQHNMQGHDHAKYEK